MVLPPGMSVTKPRLGVVIVNYKRAADTIECLESLLRSSIPLKIAVVDNDSQDGSMADIAAWAVGQRQSDPASPAMAGFSQPGINKPIDYLTLDAGSARTTPPVTQLTLIDAGRNGGFAAGNNIGIKHLAGDPAIDIFWLLNNDTVVAPNAAEALVTQMDATPHIGMCGTVVRYYWRPEAVQALNGSRFSLFTGQSKSLGGNSPATKSYNRQQIIDDTDFVLGASLGVSRPFLKAVGRMDEGYFLYFEEIDWAVRNRRLDRPFALSFAAAATVYHKEGGSIGSSGQPGQRSALSDYWMARSRLRFVALHNPWAWPWHAVLTLLLVVRRLLRRQFGKALALIKALLGRDL